MEPKDWIGLTLIAFAVAMSISREIGQLVKAQEDTNRSLKEIAAELLAMRLNTTR